MKLIKFNYKKINKNKYLLIGEHGDFLFLKESEFKKIIYKQFKKKDNLYKKLLDKNFIITNKEDILNIWHERNISLSYTAPGLNIIVLTNSCNHNCIYCQVNSNKKNNQKMNISTAKNICDFILSLPRASLTIEFQGGEPLLNWKTLKYIIKYINLKKKTKNKEIDFSIVSNLSTLSYSKAKFLVENNVAICTSLDGPPEIHNKNRIYLNNNSYEKTINGIKLIRQIANNYSKVFALLTVTRFSLKKHEEIIEEYVKFKFPYIFIRPLSPMGNALKNWEKIGYEPQDFIKFYKSSLSYVINLNINRNIIFIERTALMILKKIFLSRDHKYLDLRSPCGATIGQITYNYNGDIYPCDEARMIGNKKFKIGNVKYTRYNSLATNNIVKKILISSILDTDLECEQCIYKPYCGKCPIINYSTNNDFYLKSFYRCEIYKGIMEYIFNLIQSKKYRELFKKWLYEYYIKTKQ